MFRRGKVVNGSRRGASGSETLLGEAKRRFPQAEWLSSQMNSRDGASMMGHYATPFSGTE